jgi:hypothetical protein
MDDYFRIAAGTENVASLSELPHKLLKVIDFSVKDNYYASVLVLEWLLPGREINDRQSAMTQSDARLKVHAAFVGTTVKLRLVHFCQETSIDILAPLTIYYSDDSAHVVLNPQAQLRIRSVDLPECRNVAFLRKHTFV